MMRIRQRVALPLFALVLLALLLPASLRPVPAFAATQASLVMDAKTGRTLQATNADSLRYPASLTKMMTLYLLFDAMDRGKVTPATRLRASRYAASQPPTELGLRPGQTISVSDAILAIATKSANDVAVVIAESLAGSEAAFARQMTAKARKLGMKNTTYRNASGLHNPAQVTTARDMAALGRALMLNHPRQSRAFATRSFRYQGVRYANHNHLLGVYRGMDGIKTGYTNAAGFNLVASAKRGDTRLVAAVLGHRTSASRNARMTALLNAGFRQAANPKSGVTAAKGKSRGNGNG